MLDKIQRFAEKYNMLAQGATVVCGLSGGADSVCLLTALVELSNKLGITVEAIHINHCLRGAESDRDEQFCRELCNKMNVSLICLHIDVSSIAVEQGLSIEEAARKARYKAFDENSSGKIIATAHNANDNLETAILNLVRGSALKGISGIPPVRGNIVRPLLDVSRNEIEQFLSSRNIPYVTDSTNLSDDYTRNKIRHKILPVMAKLNSSIIETSAGSLDALRAENSFIEAETDKAYHACKNGSTLWGLNRFHEVIRRRCIARLLTEHHIPYSYDRLCNSDRIALNGGKINLSGNIYLISDGINFSVEEILPKQDHNELFKELSLGENQLFDDKILHFEVIFDKIPPSTQIVNTKLAFFYIDYDKIKGRAFLRNRRYGDKIRLSGRNFTSSVKKLINENIPREKRDKLHFIEDELGTFFAEQLGVADRVKPDMNTKRLIRITITDVL